MCLSADLKLGCTFNCNPNRAQISARAKVEVGERVGVRARLYGKPKRVVIVFCDDTTDSSDDPRVRVRVRVGKRVGLGSQLGLDSG